MSHQPLLQQRRGTGQGRDRGRAAARDKQGSLILRAVLGSLLNHII